LSLSNIRGSAVHRWAHRQTPGWLITSVGGAFTIWRRSVDKAAWHPEYRHDKPLLPFGWGIVSTDFSEHSWVVLPALSGGPKRHHD